MHSSKYLTLIALFGLATVTSVKQGPTTRTTATVQSNYSYSHLLAL
jgi:hypothetical protein